MAKEANEEAPKEEEKDEGEVQVSAKFHYILEYPRAAGWIASLYLEVMARPAPRLGNFMCHCHRGLPYSS